MEKVKSRSLSIDFELFKIDSLIHLKGGLNGKISGSRIDQGRTYVDVDWENGTSVCDAWLSNSDGSSDDLVGCDITGP